MLIGAIVCVRFTGGDLQDETGQHPPGDFLHQLFPIDLCFSNFGELLSDMDGWNVLSLAVSVHLLDAMSWKRLPLSRRLFSALWLSNFVR